MFSIEFILFVLALLIPISGFILMLAYARKGDTRRQQRWRKNHGLLFWVVLPGVAGMLTLLGVTGMLPSIFSILGILLLALSTSYSLHLQKKHEEERE